ncbi:MAG: Gfo/Idh/MocA family oxidoreductase [Roseburia sp.]|nr:Gfo/Idh/MocA family oxidoreductase [Roseburia sp.]
MQKNLKWAVLGCGVIANEMAQALDKMGKHLYAVGNRTHEKAAAFAQKYHVEKVYEDFHEMFHDPDVDVIYITTPHNTHIEFAREALLNGKHVLCEKSVMLNSRELEEAIALAKQNHVIFAEAMTIWHMPLYKKLWKLLETGHPGNCVKDNITQSQNMEECAESDIPPLGRVQMIQLNFGSFKEYDMTNRFFNMNLAGGALLDIGVYALSLARSFMESQPDQVLSQVKYAPTGADEQAGILLMNENGQMATLALSLHSKQPKRAVISCENGYIEIMEYPRADRAVIVEAESGKVHEITAGATANALQYEMTDMEDAILNGNVAAMRLSDTRDVMEIMTRLRKEWGMKYPGEEW